MRGWMRRFGARLAVLAVLAVLASVLAVRPASAHDAQVPDTPGLGVVITDSGLVLPVREARDWGYLVGTTCGWEAEVASGVHVAAAEVVIDPGHGGKESGAVGENGLFEKDLNLAVAELVREHLEARGYRTVLTRTTDVQMPTVVRGEIALALSAEVFVSIHHNGGATRRSPDPGTEVFHQSRSPQSRRLAGILFEEVQSALSQFDVAWVASSNKGTKAFERKRDGKDLFGVLRHPAGVPSALVEAAYLSNPPEARLLADPTVQAVEARAIADGIVRYLTTDDPGSGHNGTTVTGRVLTTGSQHDCKDGVLDVNRLYTSRYNGQEWASVSAAAASRGETPAQFQKIAVRLLAFLIGLSGEPARPLKPSQRPPEGGANEAVSEWSPSDLVLLARLAEGFGLTWEQTQKYAALGFAYMLSLG